MYKSYSMELAGRTLTVDINRVAKQANGAALMHYGDTTVLSTATASKEPREGIDFFPLSVEYEEKMYAPPEGWSNTAYSVFYGYGVPFLYVSQGLSHAHYRA